MNLVLCMAGLSQRFRQAGYTLPKYLLPISTEKTMIELILEELLKDHSVGFLLLIANQRDRQYESKLLAILKTLNLSCSLQFIEDTKGQAETAAIASRYLVAHGRDGATIFHNIDTVLCNRSLASLFQKLAEADGVIDVFYSDSPAYSFVRVGPDGEVIQIAEKNPISRLATTGLYGFRSASAYLAVYQGIRFTKEEYISEVYQVMIEKGQRILAIENQDPSDTLVLGTPAEYEAFQMERLKSDGSTQTLL